MSQDKKVQDERLRRWMPYINDEVRAVCGERGWRHQVRRKWEVREKPVSESGIDDYEWKLIPKEYRGGEGEYFALGVDSARCVFIFQHDTLRALRDPLPGEGLFDSLFLSTFTEINLRDALLLDESVTAHAAGTESPHSVDPAACMDRLPHGLLRRFLSHLVDRWHPNFFSIT